MSKTYSRNTFLITVGAASLAACSRSASSFLPTRSSGSLSPASARDNQMAQELTQALAKYAASTKQLPKPPAVYAVTVRGNTAVVEVAKWTVALPSGLPEINDTRYAHVWYEVYNASSSADATPVRMILSVRGGRTVLQRALNGKGPLCDRIPMDAAATSLANALGLDVSVPAPTTRKVDSTEGGGCFGASVDSVTMGIDDAGSAGQVGFGHLYYQVNMSDGTYQIIEAGPVSGNLEPFNYFHDQFSPNQITIAQGAAAAQLGRDLLGAQDNYTSNGFLPYNVTDQNSNSYVTGLGEATGDLTPGQISNDISQLQNMSGLDAWGSTTLDAANIYSEATSGAGPSC